MIFTLSLGDIVCPSALNVTVKADILSPFSWNGEREGGGGKGEGIHFYRRWIKALCVGRGCKHISICLSAYLRGLV